MNKIVLECENLSKRYQDHADNLLILEDIHFSLKAGERVAIVGSSGSGKTTLLNLLAGLDRPSSGQVRLLGVSLEDCTATALDQLRSQSMGFVYQFHHLLHEFSALENVAIPLMIRPDGSVAQIQKSAQAMLDQVGLAHRMHHKPSELSGGERQRVAISRALVGEPAVVFMDEPTGNLDAKTAEDIQQLILTLSEKRHTGFVMVTHDVALARKMDRMYHLEYGKLQQMSV